MGEIIISLLLALSFPRLYHGFSSLKCSSCGSFFCEEGSLWFAMQIRSLSSSGFSFNSYWACVIPRRRWVDRSSISPELLLLFSHEPPPRVIILEIGTNDLSSHSPKVVIGDLLDLIEFLQSVDSSTAVSVCKVLPLRHRSTGLPHEEFNTKAATFNRMLDALFDDRPSVFLWGHLEMQSLSRQVSLPDGVHLNCHRQYCLYRSYRGAILKGVSLLHNVPSAWDVCMPDLRLHMWFPLDHALILSCELTILISLLNFYCCLGALMVSAHQPWIYFVEYVAANLTHTCPFFI